MSRHIWSNDLANRSRRLKLSIRKKPYSTRLGDGVNLQYQRNKGPGSWLAAIADGKGGQKTYRLATADDYEASDDAHVLTFNEAQDKARLLGRHGPGAGSIGPVTLGTVLDQYAADLAIRGRDRGNADRVRLHAKDLLDIAVVALTPKHFADWRRRVGAALTAGNFNRVSKAFAAALSAQARIDRRLDPRAWHEALRAIPNARRTRNTVHPPAVLTKIVRCAYAVGPAAGLMIEVLASTGTRPSQACKLTVGDLLADRLMMPRSAKGGGVKMRTHVPVPIAPASAVRLRLAAGGRDGHAPLLLQDDGTVWTKGTLRHLWGRVAADAGLAAGAGAYSLRHTFITHALLKNTPVRVVAEMCDTSVKEIEATYGAAITDHADALARAAIPDFGDLSPADMAVVPLRR